jgi:hypothetical protein
MIDVILSALFSIGALFGAIYYSGTRIDLARNQFDAELRAFNDEREELVYAINAAHTAIGESRRAAMEARGQVQAACIKAFSAPQMMEWMAAASVTSKAPDLSFIVRQEIPALANMKPGGLNND